MDVGQGVAHKGPFTFPITGGKRPRAGAGGGIFIREDADADARSELMMFFFLSFAFTFLPHSLRRTSFHVTRMNGTSSYIYIAYLTIDSPTATLFTVPIHSTSMQRNVQRSNKSARIPLFNPDSI